MVSVPVRGLEVTRRVIISWQFHRDILVRMVSVPVRGLEVTRRDYLIFW